MGAINGVIFSGALAGFFLSVLPEALSAQSLSVLSDAGGISEPAIKNLISVVALGLLPVAIVTCTSFPFIVTVMSIIRQAIGLQQSPPNLLIVALSLFLTLYIMEPAIELSWKNGVSPYLSGQIGLEDAVERASPPFKSFMEARTTTDTLVRLSDLRTSDFSGREENSVSTSVLIPAFMLDEISRAFQIGFLVFLPFLVIDIVVAAILMSIGMMMVPPAIVSLPFKLAFFVVADGWVLIGEALVGSYR